MAEKPSLLHPEIDNGRAYFFIQSNGEIKGLPDLSKEQQRRADYTIDCVKLNRWDLIEKRKKIVDNFLFDIENQLLLLLKYTQNGQITDKELLLTFATIFTKMASLSANTSEFTLLGEDIWKLVFKQIQQEQGDSAYNLFNYTFLLFTKDL